MVPATADSAKHRADIQVLRGLAILAVVAYHSGLLPGGFRGVDAFFVVSGFVIGSRLLDELRLTGRVDLKRFFARRAMRLLPSLFLLLLVIAVAGVFLTPIGALGGSRRAGLAALVGGANVYFQFFGSDYHSVGATQNPLLHTWSLGVEEQFYLLAPVLLAVAWRRRGGVVALAILASASFFVWAALELNFAVPGIGVGARVAFYSLVPRIWEFSAGVAAATVALRPAHRGLRIASFGALGAGMLVDERWFIANILVVLAVLLLVSTEPPSLSRPGLLAWVGDHSYSWYLWHWPLIVWGAALFPVLRGWPLIPAIVSLLPAVAARRWVEERFRNREFRIGFPFLSATVIAAGLLFAVQPFNLEGTKAIEDFRVATASHADATARCRGTRLIELPGSTCELTTGESGLIVLLGDSNAGHFSEAVLEVARATDHTLLVSTASACPPFLVDFYDDGRPWQRCRERVEENLAAVVALDADIVVLGSASALYVQDDSYVFSVDGSRPTRPEAKAKELLTGVNQTLDLLGTSSVLVVIPLPLPRHDDWDVRHCASITIALSPHSCTTSTDATLAAAYNELARGSLVTAAATNTNAITVDLTDSFCDENSCLTVDESGNLLYRDAGHLTIAGSLATSGSFLEAVGG